MTARLLEGKPVASRIREEIGPTVQAFRKQYGIAPTLAVVRVGHPPAAVSYSHSIDQAFTESEMGFQMHVLPDDVGVDELLARLEDLARANDVHGILLQRPLPQTLDVRTIMAVFPVAKDVEGVTPANVGNLAQDAGDYFMTSTPCAAIEILKHYAIPLEGRHAVVVGRSDILGKPMALLLLREHATVSICHSRTRDLETLTRQADLLITAAGRAKLVKADMVAEGAVVVDFGVSVLEDRLVGDVDFDSVSPVASAITPVPGGTGPVSTMVLMRNTLQAAQKQAQQKSEKGRIRWLPILKPPKRVPKT